MEGCQPIQTSEVLNRYAANPKPHTLIATRAHQRWLRGLLQICNVDALTTTLPVTNSSFRRHPYFKQHSFSVDEVQRLYQAADDDAYTRLVLQILFTTGLRVGGLSRIPLPTVEGDPVVITGTDGLLSGEARCCQEKGGVPFPVFLAPCVWSSIRRWWTTNPPSRPQQVYLLPSRRNIKRPVSTSKLKHLFRRLCRTAGVVGPHAHIHTTRHTIRPLSTRVACTGWLWLCASLDVG